MKLIPTLILLITLPFLAKTDILINFRVKSRTKKDSSSHITFVNKNMTTFYDRVHLNFTSNIVKKKFILNSFYKLKPAQYLNIFDLDTEEDFNCYDNFFVNKLQICPKYFDNTFDNFILQHYNTSFVQQKSDGGKNKRYLIFDNSMSKKDLGIFDENHISWQSTLTFKLESYRNFKTKVKTVKFIFVVFLSVLVIGLVWSIFKYYKLGKIMVSEEE